MPFLFLPRRWLGIASLLFVVQFITGVIPYPVGFPDDAWLHAHVTAANLVYKQGSFLQIFGFEWHELAPIFPLHVFIMARTVALFLFGAFCWRIGILKNLRSQRRTLLITGVIGVILGATLTVLTSSLVRPNLFGPAENQITNIAELALTLGYAGSILFATTESWGFAALRWAAPLGKMAFTNYIAQSVIFSFLFFGWGLGWYGMRAMPAFLVGIAVYVLQVIVSPIWLKRFRFGPIEWLWRTMMYGSVQPMRLTPDRKSSRKSS